jgi:DNA adenine methylase
MEWYNDEAQGLVGGGVMKKEPIFHSFVPYMGGKTFIAKWIVSLMPPHKAYVEVFGGGASVLFAKPPSEVEVYNDAWDDIVNLFRVLRDEPEELQRRARFTPYARSEFERFMEKMKRREFTDDVDRALTLFFLLNASINATMDYFSTSKVKNDADEFANCVDRILNYAERFRRVVIENLDFRDVIKKYNSADTLFYCDPPYLRTGPELKQHTASEYYFGGFSYRDWYELAGLLNRISGKAMVSSYYFRELEDLFPKDRWIWMEKEVSKSSTASAGKQEKAVELLLLNYKPSKSYVKHTAKSIWEVVG